jgi:hypothetical protein
MAEDEIVVVDVRGALEVTIELARKAIRHRHGTTGAAALGRGVLASGGSFAGRGSAQRPSRHPATGAPRAHPGEVLGSVADVSDVLSQRTWTLVSFEQPCLFTAENPLVHINPSGESLGYGAATAERMHMPVSPSHALVLSHPWTSWPEATLGGTTELARRLNWAMLSYPSNRELLLHPTSKATRCLAPFSRRVARGPGARTPAPHLRYTWST